MGQNLRPQRSAQVEVDCEGRSTSVGHSGCNVRSRAIRRLWSEALERGAGLSSPSFLMTGCSSVLAMVMARAEFKAR